MSSEPRSFRQRLVRILTKTSHASAPFITTFLLIHLSAPVLANIGGSSLSSQVMLLGREYYQTKLGEPYLVLGPLAVHALSGIIRRALISYPKLKAPANASSSFLGRIRSVLPTTVLPLTGFATALLLPIHFCIHRLLPTTSSPPVSSLGPSELDFSFVQYGLHNYPIVSWTLYATLVGAAVIHAVEGGRVLLDPKFRRKLLAVAIALPVLSGLYFLHTEPMYIFPDMAKRLEALPYVTYPNTSTICING
ncbi:hypothetical protein BDP27DRAFT_1394358 [Rhodocollybia butyracea]|uniref:Mitochondrial adapter protein MCP1 transmembrane domain-containing protein n=1 Tax=Rhodocollybia butyracea TaxID=206335 RepID=A0A9P5TZC6_9AGAR|nr:hypothetical protein BDP27DRAFT_1394358 [Rhodocollybia butyracea]